MSQKDYCDRCNAEIPGPVNRVKVDHTFWYNKKNWINNRKGISYAGLDLCNDCSKAFGSVIEDFRKNPHEEATDA